MACKKCGGKDAPDCVQKQTDKFWEVLHKIGNQPNGKMELIKAGRQFGRTAFSGIYHVYEEMKKDESSGLCPGIDGGAGE